MRLNGVRNVKGGDIYIAKEETSKYESKNVPEKKICVGVHFLRGENIEGRCKVLNPTSKK